MGFEQILVAEGQVSEETLAYARATGEKAGTRLAATLVRLGLADEEQVAAAFCKSHGLPSFQGKEEQSAEATDLNPRFLRRHAAAVIGEEADGLHIAMADVEDQELLDGLTFATELPVRRSVATFSQIEELHRSNVDESEFSGLGSDVRDDFARLVEGESEAPVIRRVQALLDSAAQRRASDVHIEPMARQVVVRFRIDGRLVEAERLSNIQHRERR